VAIAYLNEEDDAAQTAKLVEAEGRRCVLIPGDLASEAHCGEAVSRTTAGLGGLDVLVLHHGAQQPAADVTQLSTGQLERTFRVNVLSLIWLVQTAVPHMGNGSPATGRPPTTPASHWSRPAAKSIPADHALISVTRAG
jgi:NAD(P)-dependent dehydrogenase (short-subunit alcohol dehydrogenase family)